MESAGPKPLERGAKAPSPDCGAPAPSRAAGPRGARRRRIGGALVLLASLPLLARWIGFDQVSDVEGLRAAVARAGSLGVLVYGAAFCFGLLVYIPGTFFVAVGVLIYGQLAGFGIAFFASIVAASISFLVIRGIGGKLLTEFELPLLRRMLAHLDARPFLVVAGLRLFFFLAPPVNYALSLSSVRFRDYFLGTAVGLLPQLVLYTVLVEWLIQRLSA